MKKSELRKMAEEMFNHGLIICKYNFKQKEKKALEKENKTEDIKEKVES